MIPSQDEIDQQLIVLATHRRTLAYYLQQQAAHGLANSSPNIFHGILEARENIRRIKGVLRGWNVAVEDHPDDEPPPDSRSTPTRSITASKPDALEFDTIDIGTLGDIPAEELPPFIVGPPISHPACFFGRAREIRRLFNLLKRTPLQNSVIIGPRRSGKTSLLLYLMKITRTPRDQLRPDQHIDWLPSPERYRWIFVDFQDPRLGGQGNLLRYLLARLRIPAPDPCNLDRFIDVVSCNLRNPTVILLDEIGIAMKRYPELDDTFWEGIRALATTQVGGNLAFVLAAHEPPDQLARHGNLGSPFFNIFGYTASLGPLAEQDARSLIASSPIPFPDADVEWVLNQSKRWPVLLQILCRERLVALEDGETDAAWQAEALRQIAPFRYLLALDL